MCPVASKSTQCTHCSCREDELSQCPSLSSELSVPSSSHHRGVQWWADHWMKKPDWNRNKNTIMFTERGKKTNKLARFCILDTLPSIVHDRCDVVRNIEGFAFLHFEVSLHPWDTESKHHKKQQTIKSLPPLTHSLPLVLLLSLTSSPRHTVAAGRDITTRSQPGSSMKLTKYDVEAWSPPPLTHPSQTLTMDYVKMLAGMSS